MEIVLLLLIILVLLGIRGNLSAKNKELLYEMSKLKSDLSDISTKLNSIVVKKQVEDAAQTTASENKKEQPEFTAETTLSNAAPIEEVLHTTEAFQEVISFNTVTPTTQQSDAEQKVPLMPLYENDKHSTEYIPPTAKKKRSFMEKNPDLEKFIGENLVNKIGIAILVLGIGYFVKFAIDKDWINEIGRVAIGILCGGILIGLAHRLRKDFMAFSSVLVGGGIAVLYFTVSLAFHDYHLFSQTVAFSIMVCITAFAVLLAIAYDKIELAVLAIIGGFGSPFFVSTGQGNHLVLFSYLLILNGGMLALAYHKKWSLINIICYAFTILIFGGWLLTKYNHTLHRPLIVFGFAAAFYLVFFMMNVLYNLKNKLPFQVLDLSLLLSNTFLFFSAGLYLLNGPGLTDIKGLFTVAMGMFNLGLAYPLYKRQHTDKNLIFMLIGLVLTFISLAAPIQLHGHYITLFWAAESVLLLWLGQKSEIKLIKQTSILLLGLMLVSLAMDWNKIYAHAYAMYLLPFSNKVFVTGVFAVAAMLLQLRLLRPENEHALLIGNMPIRRYQQSLKITMILLLYLVLLFEIIHQFNYFYKQPYITNIVITSYFITYVVLLLKFSNKVNNLFFNRFKIVLLAIAIFNIITCNQSIITARNEVLSAHVPYQLFFWMHLYIMAMGFYFIYCLQQSLLSDAGLKASSQKWVYWLSAILLLLIASMTSDHLVAYCLFSKSNSISYILSQHHKFGYALLWGAMAFLLINTGMRNKIREQRIIALTLFTLVVVKLFVYDISNISEAGRIVAFVLLGVLLLLVSFMYQRLKKLIITDHDSNETKTDL